MSSTSPAVGRALDVLLYFASAPGPVAAAVLARDLGIPRSSAYHLLEVMVERGFAVYLPEQRSYGLGVAAFEVGSAYLRHEPLELLARPIVKRLAASVRETTHLGVLHGAESLYLIKEQPPLMRVPVTSVTDIGVRLPAHLTANGRSMLAHLPRSQIRALFPATNSFIDRTGRGPATLSQLLSLIAAEKRQGWAEEDGMIAEGLQSVGACAFDHSGRPYAAISITRRKDRSGVPLETLVGAARRGARQLTKAVSGRAPEGWFASLRGPRPAAHNS